jgi:hypothetical protein
LSNRPIRSIVLVVLGSLALLWPALINGGPFWFPDTSNYVRAADGAVVYATGRRSEWSDRLTVVSEQATVTTEAASSDVSQLKPTRPVYSGRSIYYGLLLYLPLILLGIWGSVVVQALITTGVLVFVGGILARELRLAPSHTLVSGGAILVLVTPLPFYTSMLMPDVYSGLLILTLAVAIAFFDTLSRPERWGLVLISALFATFHTTNLLITGAVAAAALLVSSLAQRRLRAVALVLPVLAVGAFSIVLFNVMVQLALDEKPVSPPFLSARLTAAGPGVDYLRGNCRQEAEPFVLCRHRHRLPLESDSFLWSEESDTGLFQLLSQKEQRAIGAQDSRFFMATLAHDPLGFAAASGRSVLEQLLSFDLENFNYPKSRTGNLLENYPRAVAQAIAETRAASRKMPVAPFVWFSIASTLIGGGVIASVAVRSWRGNHTGFPDGLWYLVGVLLLGVLANSAICGALSGPHARYQMRLIWIVPFAAMIIVIAARRQTLWPEAAEPELTREAAR